jgi:hypothetical protein|tara:strand:+ start:56736 stop:57326 length:591 start_codon:yes stop_codon:yes gene_type:complete
MEIIGFLFVVGILIGVWTAATRAAGRKGWTTTANGNLVHFSGQRRLTVFPRDGGWKYCLALTADDEAPCFSDVYETQDHAKFEGLAFLYGTASQYRSLTDLRRRERAKRSYPLAPQLFEDARAAIDEANHALEAGTEPRAATALAERLFGLGNRLQSMSGDLAELGDHADAEESANLLADTRELWLELKSAADEPK